MAGKRYWAIAIKQLLISLIVVFLIGALYDYSTNDSDYRSPLMAGLVGIAIYIFLSVCLSILNAMSGAFYLWIFAGNDMVSSILDDLRASRIPPPRPDQPKNFDYLEMLANDESESANDRVRAAVLLGGYNAAMVRGLFRSLAMRKALDEGVLRYSQEAPQRRP
jgi:hypothetical protein